MVRECFSFQLVIIYWKIELNTGKYLDEKLIEPVKNVKLELWKPSSVNIEPELK